MPHVAVLVRVPVVAEGGRVIALLLAFAVVVSPASVTLSADQPSQVVHVTKQGKGATRWTIVSPAEWFTVTPTSGTNSASITVTLRSGLEAGTYQDVFVVVGRDGAQTPVSVSAVIAEASPPPPPPSGVGPNAAILCPSGAVDIWPGQSIQTVVNTFPAGTSYCLRAGVYPVTSAVTPKTGDTFTGEYGAILDGSGWTTADDTQGAFRAHNQDIDYVTIRNLVIRNMPQKAIQSFHDFADHWTVEHNELAYSMYGIEFAPDFLIRRNFIHHNSGTIGDPNPALRGGGYIGQRADRVTFEDNEIAYNGPEQKVAHSANVTFRNNFVHHNLLDGIWYDTNYAAAARIEGNLVEDNGRAGIDLEATNGAIVRNNTIRRNADDGVFIFRSQNVETYSNTIEGNLGGVEYFILCEPMLPGEDLANNSTHDNTITVGTTFSYPWAAGFSFQQGCPEVIEPYLNGSKNLTFTNNTYHVPSVTLAYWLWGGLRTWAEWQAIGQQ
jgi:parallel beta-helix repeat protein